MLRLTSPIHTRKAKAGDRCEFATAHDIFLGLDNRLIIPAGTPVEATLVKVQRRKRPFQKAEVLFQFNHIVPPKGSTLPFQASILRVTGGVLQEGPDLILREGMVVEVILTKDILIPATNNFLAPFEPSPAAHSSHPPATDSSTTPQTPSATAERSNSASTANDDIYTFRTDVDLVLVDAVVRKKNGKLIEDLVESDFIIYEDGVEQTLLQFSRDKLPVAIALVVDSSDSVKPYVEELRAAVQKTLSLLKPEDMVALFTFTEDVTRVENLTSDLDRVAGRIAEITPQGYTNIFDAIFDASFYLHQAAPKRRHAIILVSDNRATALIRASESGALRMALQTETVIYNVKLPSAPQLPRHRILAWPVWVGDYDLVERMTRETGGEIIEINRAGSLSRALETIVARLKRRYSLGYISTNQTHDQPFRKLDIKLIPQFGQKGKNYTVHARRGYYHFR